MHYALTLYLIASTPFGTVVPARTPPVFDTLNECMDVGSSYQGMDLKTKFICDVVKDASDNTIGTKK